MSKLGIKTQNKRGGNPLWKDDLGYVAVFVDGRANDIIVDAFVGTGEDYMRRDQSLININKDGRPVFSGTFDELIKLLTPL